MLAPYDEWLQKALGLLARREHATQELLAKLVHKGADSTIAAQVVDYCCEHNYVSDSRFAEHFIMVKSKQGWGPIYCKNCLLKWDINIDLIDRYIAQVTRQDWIVYALQWLRKTTVVNEGVKLSNKQMSKLIARGFSYSLTIQIQDFLLNSNN